MRRYPLCAALTLTVALASACGSDDSADPYTPQPGGSGGASGSGGSGGSGGATSKLPEALGQVPLQTTIKATGLGAPVEAVRDEAGVPHIYAETTTDAAFAQGYLAANDRFVQMDIFRRNASGTLAEVFGNDALANDIDIRVHHLRATAEATWATLQASAEPSDREIVRVMSAYAAGVNTWLDELKEAKHSLPDLLAGIFYDPQFIARWTEVDSLSIGELQAFGLSFDYDADLLRTLAFEREKAIFAGAADAEHQKRDGFVADLTDFRPLSPVYTVSGWGEVGGEPRPAPAGARQPAFAPPLRAPEPDHGLVDLIGRVQPAFGGLPAFGPGERGSNNWVVSGALSKSGNAMVANDTHLSLTNPSLFYLVHVSSLDGLDVMGVQFPGIPFIILGFNQHVAWGATVSQLDVTDLYDERVVTCAADGAKLCVVFKGAEVPLGRREEKFVVSTGNNPATAKTRTVTFYDVPHHGPLLPSIVTGPDGLTTEPPQGRALSVRYTGYDSYPIFRAINALNRSKGVAESIDAVEKHFAYGRQNWVFADVAGNIGWTQAARLPNRPAGTKPWLVLPGEDGSAEWDGYVDPKKIPHAINPAKNYLITANADPIGVTGDNQPMEAQAPAGGYPLYIGADYDPGTRVSRITTRITEATGAGGKLDPDAMAAIQADAVTEFGGALRPHFVAAAKALAAYVADPASHPEFEGEAAAGVVSAKAEVRNFYDTAAKLVEAWTLDTPSGLEPGITSASIDDSRAMLLVTAFSSRLAKLAIGDEAAALSDADQGLTVPFSGAPGTRLLPRLLDHPETLQTGDVLFDDLTTPAVETRELILARAVTEAIAWAFETPSLGADPTAWRWGSVHTVKPAFFLPLAFLDQPDAYPRHGGTGTVDVADPGFGDDNYTFRSGAAIRFVCELDPVKGPVARNVIPGGQIFDEKSPHYNDQLKLWAQNKALTLPFRLEEVVERAKKEEETTKLGRLSFQPR